MRKVRLVKQKQIKLQIFVWITADGMKFTLL